MPKDARELAAEVFDRWEKTTEPNVLLKAIEQDRRECREEEIRAIRDDITNRLTATDRDSWADALRCVLTFPCLQLPEPAADTKSTLLWWEAVVEIQREHNGVFSVELFLGHDGHHVCTFRNYNKGDAGIVAEGESGRSIQEAVERCIADWRKPKLDPRAVEAAQISSKKIGLTDAQCMLIAAYIDSICFSKDAPDSDIQTDKQDGPYAAPNKP